MADLEIIAEDLSALTVIEAAELSKLLEEKWGVSAAAPVAVAAAAPGADAGGEATAEKDAFTVMLTAIVDKKINVIMEVRAITGLGLKEAKDLVEGAPKPVKEDVAKDEAEEIKGEADANASRIYAEAYSQSPQAASYYEFKKTLEAYEQILNSDVSLILTTDSPLFRLFKTFDSKVVPENPE